MICKYSDAEILRSVSFRPGIEVFCKSEAVISLVLWFLHRNIIFHGLVIFLLSLIFSYHFRLWIVRRISMRSHLSYIFHIFTTYACLMANLISTNLTLFLTVHFCAVHGYAVIYMYITYVMLLFHSATAMWLPHVLFILICLL